MPANEGEYAAPQPLGSHAEQHVIKDTIDLRDALKTARQERDERYRFRGLVVAFLAGLVIADLMYGGKFCHRVLVMVDRWIHPGPYDY